MFLPLEFPQFRFLLRSEAFRLRAFPSVTCSYILRLRCSVFKVQTCVVAGFVSFASGQGQKLTHSAAPPFRPRKSEIFVPGLKDKDNASGYLKPDRSTQASPFEYFHPALNRLRQGWTRPPRLTIILAALRLVQSCGGPKWTRTTDLTIISRVL